jgi:hypothetical protein
MKTCTGFQVPAAAQLLPGALVSARPLTEPRRLVQQRERSSGVRHTPDYRLRNPKLQELPNSNARENTSVTKERLQRARSCLRCALQFSICFGLF